MICPKCGADNETNSAFCANCGEKLPITEPVAAEPAAAEQPKISKRAAKKAEIEALPEQYRPVGPFKFFGFQLLYSIPVVGLVFLIINTFRKGNVNLRNHAIAQWLMVAVRIICGILVCSFLIGVVMGIVSAIKDYEDDLLDAAQDSINDMVSDLPDEFGADENDKLRIEGFDFGEFFDNLSDALKKD